MTAQIHIYRGPAMEEPKPMNPLKQRSAAFCPACKRYRVQTLVVRMPVMDPDTMREDQLMAAAFCGPEVNWQCPCGELLHANWEIEW